VISYRDILKVFSPKSPTHEVMDQEFNQPKFYGINNPTYSRLSDTSDSDEEMDLDEVICSRKRTRPTPLDTKVKRDKFGIFMTGTTQTVDLLHDLALSSSDSEMDEVAAIIEANILQ
jgi:hypothetical protein